MQDIKYVDETARVYLGYCDSGFWVVTVFLSFCGESLDVDEWVELGREINPGYAA